MLEPELNGSGFHIGLVRRSTRGMEEKSLQREAPATFAARSPAVRAALETHGAELFGFFIAALEEFELAREAYVAVRQHVANELGEFQGRCSLRAWLYGLARRELKDRRLRKPRGRSDRPATVSRLARTPMDDLSAAIAAIRRTLTDEDRELFILKVDRGFDWLELAFTSLGERAEPASLAAEARELQVRVGAISARVERLAAGYRFSRQG
jgi:DNA-directed RNA polymerase specialized sigma24 family protein